MESAFIGVFGIHLVGFPGNLHGLFPTNIPACGCPEQTVLLLWFRNDVALGHGGMGVIEVTNDHVGCLGLAIGVPDGGTYDGF